MFLYLKSLAWKSFLFLLMKNISFKERMSFITDSGSWLRSFDWFLEIWSLWRFSRKWHHRQEEGLCCGAQGTFGSCCRSDLFPEARCRWAALDRPVCVGRPPGLPAPSPASHHPHRPAPGTWEPPWRCGDWRPRAAALETERPDGLFPF